MNRIADIRERIRRADPLLVDTAIALSLAALACLVIWMFTHERPFGMEIPAAPNFPIGHGFARRPPQDGSAYLLALLAFLPLALRRKVPWLALVLSGAGALAFELGRMPPAPVILGPMIALYTLALCSRRRVGLVAALATGVVFAVSVFALSSSVRWVAEAVGSFVMLAAAALIGMAERNRREYVAEVEQRAAEAERTREEEARRRVDEERIRIAREVHDIVAHSLSIVTVQAAAAAALLPDHPERARESVENVRAAGKQALAELRSMLDVLRTGEGDRPLEPEADLRRVDALVSAVRDAGPDVALETSGDLASVPAYASVSAYRIVQEALTNVVRHAGARTARITIAVAADHLTVAVTDDGAGMPDDAGDPAGHGIRGMRERVEALGGTFSAGPAMQGGFAVGATIPLRRSAS